MLADAAHRLHTTVADLMTRRPITIGPEESVAVAATLLRTCRVRHLPVAASGALVGVVSLRDLLAADDQQRIGDIMSKPVQTTRQDVAVEVAAERLLGRRISCLPVVDGDKLIGIFTATDALRFAGSALADEGRAQRRAPGVAQLMTPRPLLTVGERTTLAEAWQRMRDNHVRHLPVLAGDEVVGMLSDRDVLAAGRQALRVQTLQPAMLVADAMSTRLSTIDADAPATEAADALLRRRLGALPVLRGRELIGIVTVSDFMYWILARA